VSITKDSGRLIQFVLDRTLQITARLNRITPRPLSLAWIAYAAAAAANLPPTRACNLLERPIQKWRNPAKDQPRCTTGKSLNPNEISGQQQRYEDNESGIRRPTSDRKLDLQPLSEAFLHWLCNHLHFKVHVLYNVYICYVICLVRFMCFMCLCIFFFFFLLLWSMCLK